MEGPPAATAVRSSSFFSLFQGGLGGWPEPVVILDSVADNSRARQMTAQDDAVLLQFATKEAAARVRAKSGSAQMFPLSTPAFPPSSCSFCAARQAARRARRWASSCGRAWSRRR